MKAQLPGDRVESILVDEFGCIWFGTDHGLLRKCAEQWNAYPVWPDAPGSVKDMDHCPSPAGSMIWVGTEKGILRIQYDSISINSATHYSSESNCFLTDVINGITSDGNAAVYFATPAGIGIRKEHSWEFLTDIQDIVANEFTTVRTAGDTIYFGTMGEGVARIVKNVDAYTGASSLMAPWSALPGNDITCIFVDSKGYRWFGSDYGLSRHSGPEAKEGWDESYTKDLPDPCVSSIAEDRNGNIWIGTFDGLVKFTRGEKGNRSVWTVEKGLPSNTILDIFITQQGRLWIGTDRGAACFDGSGFSLLKTSDQAKGFPEFREFIKLKRK